MKDTKNIGWIPIICGSFIFLATLLIEGPGANLISLSMGPIFILSGLVLILKKPKI